MVSDTYITVTNSTGHITLHSVTMATLALEILVWTIIRIQSLSLICA